LAISFYANPGLTGHRKRMFRKSNRERDQHLESKKNKKPGYTGKRTWLLGLGRVKCHYKGEGVLPSHTQPNKQEVQNKLYKSNTMEYYSRISTRKLHVLLTNLENKKYVVI